MRNYFSVFVFAAILLSGKVGAQVPKLVNYQGHVAVDDVNFEGAGQFKFVLVNSAGTISFWSNDGTSAGGSEPAAAVTLSVAKGLYSVLLGDVALVNMTVIPGSVFTNPDVRLRVWFNDGVNGSQLLTPDQRLAPAAYLADGTVTSASVGAAAITSGKIAPGAVDGTNIAPASVTSGSFAVPGAPNNGQVLGYNNGGLTWTAPGGGVFSLNGASAYYNGGNVGIGTTTPAAKFEVNGLLRSTRVGIAVQYIQLNGGDPNSINLTAQSSVAAEKNLFIENLSGEAAPGPNNNIQFVLGTTAAHSTKMTLTKDGNISLPLGGSGGGIQIGTPNFETGLSIVGTNRADIRFDGSTLKLLAGAGPGIPSSGNGITINTSGNVGIGGSLTPVAKLEVVANDALRLIGTGGAFLTILDSGAGYSRGRIQSVGGEIFLGPESWVNGSNPNGYVKIANSGNLSAKTVTIRGGADLAEPFAMSEHGVPAGAVVSIDLHHPGKLKMSATAYDRKVAGIVSGANGINPGISMIDEEHLEAGENVALSGRVYVKANTSAGRIGPGDLLTTSDVPGEAMKATNHQRAQGAILGKAMTSLDKAAGTILVLVTLQ